MAKANMILKYWHMLLMCLSGLIACGTLHADGNLQIYTPKIIVEGNWGSAADEFGLKEGSEIETIGPRTFCLDKNGHIFIFDTVHQNLKKFTSEGNYLGTIGSNISGSAMAINDEGYIFVLEGHLLHEYSPMGNLIKNYEISRNIQLVEGYGQGIMFDNSGNLFVNNLQKIFKIGTPVKQTGKIIANHLSVLSSTQQLTSEKNGIVCKSNGNRFQTEVKDKHNATLRILNEDKNLLNLKEITMSIPDVFGSVLFLGSDNQGGIYIETERITKDNYVHLEVRKYDSSGNLLSVIELPNDYYTTVYKKIEVDNNGNIYQLLTTSKGVQLIKWQQK